MFYVGNLAKKEAFHESQGTSSSSFPGTSGPSQVCLGGVK